MSLSRLHDPYEVLGVSVDATVKEITTAYRKLSLQYHPDKHPDLEEHYQPLFVKVGESPYVPRTLASSLGKGREKAGKAVGSAFRIARPRQPAKISARGTDQQCLRSPSGY